MKQITTTAIILKRLNFGEADRIITVITPNNGKVSMLAKGVRRQKSKLAGGLELFSVTDIIFIDGKSDLKTIVSTRLKTHYREIVKNVDRTMAGYDFMKSIDDFTQHGSENNYYNVLQLGLEGLGDNTLSLEIVQVWFFAQLLQVHGSNINIEKPLRSEKFAEDEKYNFSYEDMSFFANSNGEFEPKHIKFLRLVIKASSPNKLSLVQGSNNIAKDLVQILKQSAMMHKA